MTAIGAASMWWPIAAMALLTFAVWGRLFMVRIREMRRRRIDPQAAATSGLRAGVFEDTRASDNFINLFELSVMFYVGAFAAIRFALVDGARSRWPGHSSYGAGCTARSSAATTV